MTTFEDRMLGRIALTPQQAVEAEVYYDTLAQMLRPIAETQDAILTALIIYYFGDREGSYGAGDQAASARAERHNIFSDLSLVPSVRRAAWRVGE